jgi:rfaE bifunctional protein nucleotidyltransferase chain/domain
MERIIPFEWLPEIRKKHPGKTIVHCHGVFDVLHIGHLSYFESARKFGDILVVTLTTDKFVNKGPGRPYFAHDVRATMIAALHCVDYVSVSPNPTAVDAIEKLSPDFYVKGPDYRDKTKDVSGGIYEEESAVERCNGKLVFTDDIVFSSSTLINKYFAPWSKDQQKTIDMVKEMGGVAVIDKVLERMSNLKVCVVGEPIVDSYVFCLPEAISSKSPSISSRYIFEEQYPGGSLAIANHLADFVGEVRLVCTQGEEAYVDALMEERLDPRIKRIQMRLANIPTPKKTRYITIDTSQRIFEITDIRADQWQRHNPQEFCRILKDQSQMADATLIADFGHGLFENEVLETTGEIPGFIALNVQTNSSNYGFNPFTKHKKFSFLSLDTREVRLAYHDRFTAPLELGKRAFEEVKKIKASAAMTLGPNGSCFFSERTGQSHRSPAFADKVVDATGAGDAFFALTALLLRSECPDPLIPFLGNVFAGLKTKIIGNKNAVTKAEFMKAYSTILK